MICRTCGTPITRGDYDLCEGCREYLYRSRSGCAVYEGYRAGHSLRGSELVTLRFGHKVYSPNEIRGWGPLEVAAEALGLGFKFDKIKNSHGYARTISKVFFKKVR